MHILHNALLCAVLVQILFTLLLYRLLLCVESYMVNNSIVIQSSHGMYSLLLISNELDTHLSEVIIYSHIRILHVVYIGMGLAIHMHIDRLIISWHFIYILLIITHITPDFYRSGI